MPLFGTSRGKICIAYLLREAWRVPVGYLDSATPDYTSMLIYLVVCRMLQMENVQSRAVDSFNH